MRRPTPERYSTMASDYKQEQAERKQALEFITASISKMDLREQYIREFMVNARAHIEISKQKTVVTSTGATPVTAEMNIA